MSYSGGYSKPTLWFRVKPLGHRVLLSPKTEINHVDLWLDQLWLINQSCLQNRALIKSLNTGTGVLTILVSTHLCRGGGTKLHFLEASQALSFLWLNYWSASFSHNNPSLWVKQNSMSSVRPLTNYETWGWFWEPPEIAAGFRSIQQTWEPRGLCIQIL